jgi:formylglycine-generating enzyme required for sulfatase activity
MRLFYSYREIILACLLIFSLQSVKPQNPANYHISDHFGVVIDSLKLYDNSDLILKREKPVLSFLLNEKSYTTSQNKVDKAGRAFSMNYENKLKLIIDKPDSSISDLICRALFENISPDTLTISNVIPFESDSESVVITGKGPWDLARAYLFRPGYTPVRVILPDNAWEMGYSSFDIDGKYSVCAIARRQQTEGGQKHRYETILPPGSRVFYNLYGGVFQGEWQNGLRLMFRDKYLYDLARFDYTLYDRGDLAWIRECYVIILQMAWDREFFDRFTGKYNFPDYIKRNTELLGNVDVYGIWPTWPRLGLDQRNQWDMYRDLPGGINQLKNFVTFSHQANTKFFIAYNPWDNSTRQEDHFKGMAAIIAGTGADGVVLDTRGSSSYELQAAADSVKRGVIMYSEGMAITRDMPGIIAGRVHNAIYLSPELNLNKLIKPDFAIFRVCDPGEDLIHRELAIAFFNGYGSELNMMRPGGRGDDFKRDLDYLARTTFILRQNNDAFLDRDWIPLVSTTSDRAYVNKWRAGDKTIYTILNMKPEGLDGNLFKVTTDNSHHFVSLWHHENIVPVRDTLTMFIPVKADGWPVSWSGTRREGSVDCVAELPVLMNSVLKGDSLSIMLPKPGKVLIWKGNPSVRTNYKDLKINRDTTLRVTDVFGFYEGKLVVQLVENKRLKDENILTLSGGKPWLISKIARTEKASAVPPDMVLVPGTDFSFDVSTTEDYIPYPEVSGRSVKIDTFLIDRYPVTNAQFSEFIEATGYQPNDTTRYLMNWESGVYRQGQERYPVVGLSIEDMKAYARWAGKRLPTEAEWQLAAQGTDKRKWPWGNDFHGTLCNNAFNKPTPVDAFSKGASVYGVMDLVGNVWQMTGDTYFNGSDYFAVIRGGSYYHPDSSWWYIQGGPQSLDKTQIMLLVSPGFDRCATVGFRCVKDVDTKNLKVKGKN